MSDDQGDQDDEPTFPTMEPTELFGTIELPDGSENATDRDGILSSLSDLWATLIGFLVGLTGNLLFLVAFVAFVIGEFDGFRRTRELYAAVRSPAHGAFGCMVGLVFHILLWNEIGSKFIFGVVV